MKKITLLLIVFYMFTSKTYSQTIIFDGNNCNSTATGVEWGIPDVVDGQDVSTGTADILNFWYQQDHDYLYLAFDRVATGNSSFSFYMNTDCSASTGDPTKNGSDYATFFSISPGASPSITDNTLYKWNGTKYVDTGIVYEAKLGKEKCDGSVGLFFELKIKFSTIFNLCSTTNCNNLTIEVGSSLAGGSPNSALKDTFNVPLNVGINSIPTAKFTQSTATCLNSQMSFDASTSTFYNSNIYTSSNAPDFQDSIVSYQWDYSYDGITFNIEATGVNNNHVFTSAGTHTVALQVTDSYGCKIITSKNIIIYDAPQANFTFSSNPSCNIATSFDASSSIDKTLPNNLTYEWDFSYDGITFNNEGTGININKTFTTCGSYIVALRISDSGTPVPCNIVLTTKTVNVLDSTPPLINSSNGASIVNCLALAIPPTVPTATDNCSGTILGVLESIVDSPSPLTCEGTRTYRYTYTDCGNLVSTWVYTYTIESLDFTTNFPANTGSTIACAASLAEPNVPEVKDNCGNVLTPAAVVISETPACEGNVTYTYKFTDCEGNTLNWVYTYTIESLDFTMPANTGSTIACAASLAEPIVPEVKDNCGNVLSPAAVVISETPACEGNVTYTYKFTDCEGNTHDWVYTYTIESLDFTTNFPANTGSTIACAASLAEPIVPEVKDNCGNVLSPAAVVISETPACEGNVTYTYKFTDCEGNTHDWVYTYTIESLDFTMPANTGSTIACAASLAEPIVPEVKDNCGNVLTPAAVVISETPACEGDVTYTYKFTDCEGNTLNWVYTYTIESLDFTMPANTGSTIACAASLAEPIVPEVKDNCGNVLSPATVVISETPACEGNVTYTYKFTDCEGNTLNWVYTYTIESLDFTMPANTGSTIACAASLAEPIVPEVKDNCGNVLSPAAVVISETPACEGDVTYTYKFTDCEGNTLNWVYTYTIESLDFTMPANTGSTIACAASLAEPIVPEVKDNCGNVLSPATVVISETPACEGNVTYTYKFTDCEGNTLNWVYTYTIESLDFTMPANTGSTIACAASLAEPIVPEVKDNCGNVLSPAAVVISETPACEGNVTYTYKFTDCEGNTLNWVYTYTIESLDFTMPANTGSTIACAASLAEPNVPEVKDNCGNVLTPAAVVISETPACEGNVTYTYKFTDCEGNTLNWVYTYTIESLDFTMPANTGSTITCAASLAEPIVPEVKDNCGNVLTPAAVVISETPACEGNVTYTYKFTDCEGNTLDWVYTYTIESLDFTMPANTGSTIACAASLAEPNVPEVKDNCGNVLSPAAVVISENPACEGNVTYTYKFTDCEGNTHDWVYTYTIESLDFTTNFPANTGSTIACAASLAEPIVPEVKDNCGNVLSPAAVVISETPACEGNVTYTYKFTDCEGNTLNWVYTYTIESLDFTMPANTGSTIACAASLAEPIVPEVKDNCGNVLSPAAVVISENPACEGDVTYTYKFTECEGNTHDWVYTYTIESLDFTMPANTGSTIACAASLAEPIVPEVKDNCGNVLTPAAVVISETPACEGNVTYTYKFTDCEGNTHDWVYTYTIESLDFTTNFPANTGSTIACAASLAEPIVPEVKDNCGNVLSPAAVVISETPACEGNVTYTYKFTDCEGNTLDWVYTYTIESLDFTTNFPANTGSTIACAASLAEPNVPEVKDNCGNVLTPATVVISETPACEGNVTYTYKFTDCKGNTHDWVYTYTIESLDFTTNFPANTGSTIACAASLAEPNVPEVKDNCGNVLTPATVVISETPACEGNVTYTYKFTDCEGNTLNWVYTYTIESLDFTMPANTGSTVACAASLAEPNVPEVKDNCGNVLSPAAVVISETPACEGNVTYTYKFTDCEGNTHDWVYTYTIESEDFTTNFPANTGSTIACAASLAEPIVPEVKDNCGNVLTPAAVVISETPACEGDVTYTYKFTDCEGNTLNWVYTYTIESLDFTMPANTGSTIACAASLAEPIVPEVKDNCGNVLSPATVVISETPACEGNVTYTYKFTDCEGNTLNWVYTYTIESLDFTMPANTGSTIACAASLAEPIVPEVKDNCGNVLTPTTVVISETPACEGNVTYTYKFTDCEGNTLNWVYTYTIESLDFTTNFPANTGSTIACAASLAEPNVPEVKDNCGNVLSPAAVVISETPACEGDVTYTYKFTDCEGNTLNWVYTYTIESLDFTMPANTGSTIACAASLAEPIVPEVKDNCGNVLSPATVVISETPACEGNVTYTYKFTDCEGNTLNWVYTYTIESLDFTMPANTGSTIACAASLAEPIVPEVKDNCGNVLSPAAVVISETPACEGNVTYTYKFTDCEGNTLNWVYTYTIESLDFTMPANTGSTIACAASLAEPIVPEVKDNCGNVLTPAAVVISETPACEGNVTYTYKFTDCEGNTLNWVYTYTIESLDFTMPANTGSTIACAASLAEPIVPEVKDNCGNVLSPAAVVISETPACEGNVTYTYKFTDCEGNTHDWVYTYTIESLDFTTNFPANTGSTIACAASLAEPIVPEVKDNCGNVLSPAAVVISENPACEGDVTYTYKFTDCEGNTHDWVYTYTIESLDFTMPANTGSIVACAADIVAPTLPVVTDNCGNALTASPAVISETPACEGNVTYTYKFTDCEGNTHDWVYTYTIDDTIAPTATAPTDITGLQCIADIPPADINAIIDETDNCSGTVNVIVSDSNNDASGCKGNPYILTRTYTLTDCGGNVTKLVQTITVEDTTPPILAGVPANVTVECNAIPAVEIAVNINATDNCDATPIVAYLGEVRTDGDCANNYTLTRTWTATDACGNTASASQTINVQDTTAPVIVALPSVSTISCPATPEFTQAIATDGCGSTVTLTFADVTTNGSCAGSYSVTRTWTATDACGNAATASQTINIQDTVAPVITSLPSASTISCPATPEFTQAIATDGCGSTVTLTFADVTTNGQCAGSYSVTRTWTATDTCGNTATASQTINIQDTVAPVITSLPSASTISCPATPEFTQAIATDGCGSTVTLTFADVTTNGQCAGSYSVTRTWTATDTCGNTATASQTINIQDTVAPVITALPSTSTISCPATPVFAQAIATDGCGSTVTLTFADVTTNGSCAGSYSVTRTWTAADACGNASTASQTVNIVDTVGPTTASPFNSTINVNCDAIPAKPELVFVDNCSTVSPAIFTENIINRTENSYSIVRKWSVADTCGNASEFTQIINVTIPNSIVTISSSICNDGETTTTNLNDLLPAGTPTNGTWVDVNNSGGLQGSTLNANGLSVRDYTFEYKINDANCPRTVRVTMTVNTGCDSIVLACGLVVVHNAFSPNGDGINEKFIIDNIDDTICYPENTVEIYNRWGVLVFETKGYNNTSNSFDGISGGRSTVQQSSGLPTGTYFYILNYTSVDNNGKIITNKKDGYLYLTK